MSQYMPNPFEQNTWEPRASGGEQTQTSPWAAAAQSAYQQGLSIGGSHAQSFFSNTLARATQAAPEQTGQQAAPIASGVFESMANYFGPTARDVGSALRFGVFDAASRLSNGRSAVDNIARLGDWGLTNLHLTTDNTRERTRAEQFFGDLSSISTIRRLGANNRPEGPPIEFNGQLPPGNYQLDYRPAVFGCGPGCSEKENPPRSFLVHIPPGDQRNMPVAILVPGCSSRQEDTRDFFVESGLRETLAQADQGPAAGRAIGIVALNQRHRVGDSANACDSWNIDGAMVSPTDVDTHRQRTGYDDRDYFAGLAAIIPQIAPGSSPNHQDWTWIGASQGGAVLHRLACDPRYPQGMFRNTVTCGSTAESGDGVTPYSLQPGNGQNVTIFDHSGDIIVLPHRGQRPQWIQNLGITEDALRDRGYERINTNDQDPTAQEQIYLPGVRRIPGVQGQYRVTAFGPGEGSTTLRTQADFTVPLTTAEAVAAQRNVMWRMERVDGTGPVLSVFDLRDAPHAMAGPQVPGEAASYRSHEVNSSAIALQNLLDSIRRRRAAPAHQ
ncbi:MAG TPA: hypothetical protein V6C69_09365 [Trichormus sp.]|jgi:hypothetical protein